MKGLSPKSTSILLALILAAFGVFGLNGATQRTISDDNELLKACDHDIADARTVIAHAADVDALSAAVLREVNGVDHPPNETLLIQNVWDEMQRIATSDHVTLTDLHHDKVRSIDIETAAAQNQLPPAKVRCVAAADVPEPSSTPSPSARGAQGAHSASALQLQALPVLATMRGHYLDVIQAIADLSRARVLVRYDRSTFDASSDGNHDVTAAVTLLVYPPLRTDVDGRPIGVFGDPLQSALEHAPGASPAPSPSAGGSQ